MTAHGEQRPGRRYDRGYHEEAVLKSGRRVRLRLLRPSDADLLADAFHRLSPQSRYRRFHALKTSLTREELRYLTDIDNERHVAIGAAVDEGGSERGVGVARFVRLPDRDAAEAAVTVADDVQGEGLGRLLLERLVEAAVERGSPARGGRRPRLTASDRARSRRRCGWRSHARGRSLAGGSWRDEATDPDPALKPSKPGS